MAVVAYASVITRSEFLFCEKDQAAAQTTAPPMGRVNPCKGQRPAEPERSFPKGDASLQSTRCRSVWCYRRKHRVFQTGPLALRNRESAYINRFKGCQAEE